MQTYLKFSLYVCLLAAAMVFTSCQKEEPFQEDIDPERTLSAGSLVVETMKRTTSKDGSYDNIVDGASCLGIQFPYTVVVNGLELQIETVEDLQKIEEILDAADEGENSMQIAFPITVTLSDYTEIVVNNEDALQEVVEQCVEDGDDDDIECVDVVYPVSLFTYNPNVQQTGSITVNHDKELRRFLAGLEDADLISIDFPLTFEMFDGIEVTVNSNTELADVMDRAAELCDEDDDDDHNDDDFTKASLDSLLVTCPWSVKKLKRTDLDSSEQYEDYLLTFLEKGKVISDNGFGLVGEGQWSVSVSDFKVYLNMEFKDTDDFTGTLYTYEIGEGIIKMDGGESDEIILEQRCGYETQACSQAFIEENLQSDCRWSITDGQGEFIEDLNIDFSPKIMQTYNPNDTVVDEGLWDISGTTLAFSDLTKTLTHYIGDWEVIACSEERFRLQRGDEILVLVKNCDAAQ